MVKRLEELKIIRMHETGGLAIFGNQVKIEAIPINPPYLVHEINTRGEIKTPIDAINAIAPRDANAFVLGERSSLALPGNEVAIYAVQFYKILSR